MAGTRGTDHCASSLASADWQYRAFIGHVPHVVCRLAERLFVGVFYLAKKAVDGGHEPNVNLEGMRHA